MPTRPRSSLSPTRTALIACAAGCVEYSLKGEDSAAGRRMDSAVGETGADGWASSALLRVELPCGTRSSDGCEAGADHQSAAVTLGLAGTHRVELWIRGVAEAKLYTGGASDGAFLQEGGSPDPIGYNEYSLIVSSPPQTWYLNRGTSWERFCYLLDYGFTIEVDEGATVTLRGDSMDTAQIINQDEDLEPIVVPDISPAPDAFDGQFVQANLATITP